MRPGTPVACPVHRRNVVLSGPCGQGQHQSSSAVGGLHDPFAVEVFELPAVDGVVVGQVEHCIVDALQGAADGAAEGQAEERAMRYDQNAAAAELLGQCFEGGEA